MRCPSSRFVPGCVACVIVVVGLSLVSAKRHDATAIASAVNLRISNAASPQRAIELDPRITKIGELPEVVSDDLNGYSALQFIDKRNGWLAICGRRTEEDKSNYVVSGRLWRTRDGGKNWNLVYENPTHGIDGVDFINAETGWMIIWGEMYKTMDGGDTWHPFHQPIPPFFDGQLCDFKFLKDGRHGWVAGGIELPLIREDGEIQWPHSRYQGRGETGIRGAIFQTTDGGKSWKRQFVSKGYGEVGGLFILDENHGAVLGIAGTFYLKSGKWQPTDSDEIDETGYMKVKTLEREIGVPTIEPCGVFLLDDSIGWLSNNNGYLAKTTDGGRTWNDILNVHDLWPHREWPLQYFSDFYFRDALHGFALDSDGALRETRDGGLSWAKLSAGTSFSATCFSDSHQGWLISERELFQITP